jgi:hypothetical protein
MTETGIPLPLRAELTSTTSLALRAGLRSTTSLETEVIRATIPIVPTLYPGEPTGTVIVQNHITINVASTEFLEFSARWTRCFPNSAAQTSLPCPAGEVRDQLLAEIKAGMAILRSPKPDPKLIDLFLKNPLLYIADKGAGVVIGAAATAALALLGKATGCLHHRAPFYGLHPYVVHQAFLLIDEYQEVIKANGWGPANDAQAEDRVNYKSAISSQNKIGTKKPGA